jgi:hypothetical protein
MADAKGQMQMNFQKAERRTALLFAAATADIVKPLENQVFKCGGQGPPAHL